MPGSWSAASGGGPLVCPRCAISYPLSERFCPRCEMPLVYAGTRGRGPGDRDPRAPAQDQAPVHEGRAGQGRLRPQPGRGRADPGPAAGGGHPQLPERSAGFDVPDFLAAGPRDVLVPEAGAERARRAARRDRDRGRGGRRLGARGRRGAEAPGTAPARPASRPGSCWRCWSPRRSSACSTGSRSDRARPSPPQQPSSGRFQQIGRGFRPLDVPGPPRRTMRTGRPSGGPSSSQPRASLWKRPQPRLGRIWRRRRTRSSIGGWVEKRPARPLLEKGLTM